MKFLTSITRQFSASLHHTLGVPTPPPSPSRSLIFPVRGRPAMKLAELPNSTRLPLPLPAEVSTAAAFFCAPNPHSIPPFVTFAFFAHWRMERLLEAFRGLSTDRPVALRPWIRLTSRWPSVDVGGLRKRWTTWRYSLNRNFGSGCVFWSLVMHDFTMFSIDVSDVIWKPEHQPFLSP